MITALKIQRYIDFWSEFNSDQYDTERADDLWVNVDSILSELERHIDSGNIEGIGRNGFSAAIFLSEMKKAFDSAKRPFPHMKEKA